MKQKYTIALFAVIAFALSFFHTSQIYALTWDIPGQTDKASSVVVSDLKPKWDFFSYNPYQQAEMIMNAFVTTLLLIGILLLIIGLITHVAKSENIKKQAAILVRWGKILPILALAIFLISEIALYSIANTCRCYEIPFEGFPWGGYFPWQLKLLFLFRPLSDFWIVW